MWIKRGGVLYTLEQVVPNTYQLIFTTDMFADGCQRWNWKSVSD